MALKIAITGAGALGAAHARSAIAAGAHVVAVHDSRLDAAAKLAEACGATATDRLEEIFVSPLDGLVVTTPPPVRLAPIGLAALHGVHLFVEKPPAYDLATGRECLRLIEGADLIASCGFNLRYSPLYEMLRDMVALHEVHLVRTVCTIGYYLNCKMSPWFLQKAISGGPIAEQAIHLLDGVRWILGPQGKDGAQALRAMACGAKNMAADRPEFDAENALQMIYEIQGRHGVVFATHTNHCGHDRFAFDMELIGPHLRLHANETEKRVRGYINGEDVDVVAPAANLLGLDRFQAWLRAVETGDRSLVRAPYADSLNTLALVEAAVKSQGSERFEEVEIP